MANHTHAQMSKALNKAADDIMATLQAHGYTVADEGARDLLNLMFNVAIDYVDGAAATVEEAIERNYDLPAGEVLAWAATAL